MTEPMPASVRAAIRARVAETAQTYASLVGKPSQSVADRAALLAEVDRLDGVVQLLGSELQRDSMKVIDELKQHEPCVPIEHVERLLKRERDNYEKHTGAWHDIDDVLDTLRLHVATGTPLTEPRPQEGPEAFGVGPEPLTEAEELRRQVERLTEERDQAIAHDRQPYPTQWAYDQACAALEKHRKRADKAEAELAAIRARAHARSEELLTARDARSFDDRERRRRFEFAAHEVRAVVRPSTTGEGER